MSAAREILVVEGLEKSFPAPRGLRELLARTPARSVTAVDGVSLTVARGRVLGVIGERVRQDHARALHRPLAGP